jgi:hypothetical protein
MYSREEASKIKQQFWITFGKYMKPIPSSEGLSINWVNYKTGVKHIFFRMNADQQKAFIAIEITHPDAEIRKQYLAQFIAFKPLLNDALEEEWEWQTNTVNDYGTALSRIIKVLPAINSLDPKKWPELISFLKPRIMALDEFWSNVKPVFEAI